METRLKAMRHTVLSPMITPLGLKYDDYMHIAYSMIDCRDALYMLKGWEKSKGAKLEYQHAMKENKKIFYEGEC